MTKRFSPWLLVLLMAAIGMSGCQAAYFFMPPINKKIPADFTGLENHSVAVVVYADPGVEFEHSLVRLQVSAVVSGFIVANVKGCRIQDPRRVVRLQDENLDWDAMDKTALGKKLDVDYVLYISMAHFTTRDPGSEYMVKGDLEADVALYEVAKPERLARVWSANSMKSVFPAQSVPADNDEFFYEKTVEQFAGNLAKKFYSYEEEQKE